MSTALCPGSFDPPTNGHVDVIKRCLSIFDHVVVAIVANPFKSALFDSTERSAMLEELFEDESDRLEIHAFSGLLVDFARERKVDVIVKGLRAVSDFEYELQMAQMNESLAGINTLFLPTNPKYGYLSSSLVKEVARLGGSVEGLVPPLVVSALKERYA
ncbi:MAG TPA: pantetheine-phosphate adenylyltransferase [Acidimicrobiia bacterium]|nr:pantetheine-phosphate adenylyltransferase [Acidimicrobiia bacterium]